MYIWLAQTPEHTPCALTHVRIDVPIMTTMFGEDWDLMNRIAADPAHEFHNLVKDMLKLWSNVGSMRFKEARY